MQHVVLLGDSIFDNAQYVPRGPAVEEQVRRALPDGWTTTLLAVDGNTTAGVAMQLTRLPRDASHLFISVGGNDALQASWILGQQIHSVEAALRLLAQVRETFASAYRGMLQAVLALGKPTPVCTVYDAIPGLGEAERAALASFNEVILREAIGARAAVIDLRLVCANSADFSEVSPIEPSEAGGQKIARMIARVATGHNFSRQFAVIFA